MDCPAKYNRKFGERSARHAWEIDPNRSRLLAPGFQTKRTAYQLIR
jgi:hypothetical protein